MRLMRQFDELAGSFAAMHPILPGLPSLNGHRGPCPSMGSHVTEFISFVQVNVLPSRLIVGEIGDSFPIGCHLAALKSINESPNDNSPKPNYCGSTATVGLPLCVGCARISENKTYVFPSEAITQGSFPTFLRLPKPPIWIPRRHTAEITVSS
ncbi:hypothetical protein JTE90_028321 [Oedothorax gibbosus]|uniref:Uncharacterized protein n=1 Tax=Oedothorax gibbosus TaxID=931172 RepID=A0AAV6V4I9_9ARAC|nr:hypothetical protein JTE90_028321 [Oedothorax gibbosus]